MSKHVRTYPLRPLAALRLPAGAVLLAATAACVPGAGPESAPAWADELGNVDLSPVTTSDQWNWCPTWDCGKNHAMLNTFPVPELREDGEPNDMGLYILQFRRGTEDLELEVENGVMTGRNATNTYTGAALIDSEMTVTNGEVVWYIKIANYTDALEYWDGSDTISAYHLLYRDANFGTWEDLCNEPVEHADDPLFPDGYETYAILIDDERYDFEARKVREEVTPGDAEGWFNIACAGSALSKMMLMHFNPHISDTPAPNDQDYYTTRDQRTATLKMLTADYLGIGKPFTIGGRTLGWEDVYGWQAATGAAFEAVWDQNGARCLDEPRMAGVEFDENEPPVTKEEIFDELTTACAAYNSAHPNVVPPPCDVPEPCTAQHTAGNAWVWKSSNP